MIYLRDHLGRTRGSYSSFLVIVGVILLLLTYLLYGQFQQDGSYEEGLQEGERRIFEHQELVFREDPLEKEDLLRAFEHQELVFLEDTQTPFKEEYVEAQGLGYSPLGTNIAQLRLLARRAAVVDAQRNLLVLLLDDVEEGDLLKGAFVVEGSEVYTELEDGRIGCTLTMRAKVPTNPLP